MSCRWYYECQRCGYTTVSGSPALARCPALFANSNGIPCGGEFRDDDPYTYHWMLVDSGLLQEGQE